MSLRLFDSATRQVRDFVPLVPGQAGVYVCGATPQSGPHIGHMRSAVVFDVLQRWLERSGYRVTMVRNVTDIDDKILAKAAGLRPKRSTYAIESIKGTGLVRCKVTLPLDGSYVSLTGFLSRIGSTPRFIVVDEMALAQDEQGARMNLTLSAIFKDGDLRASQ